MAGASTYLEDWIQYWGSIGRVFTTRLQTASRAARKGDYGVDRLLSDAVALWAEGFDAWYTAWLGRGAVAPAIVFLRVSAGTEFKLRPISVPIPGNAPPDRTDLVRVSAPNARIPKEHVKVKVSPLRDELTVELTDLTNLKPADGHYEELKPAEGHYLGLVYVDERPIAVIHALVTR